MLVVAVVVLAVGLAPKMPPERPAPTKNVVGVDLAASDAETQLRRERKEWRERP